MLILVTKKKKFDDLRPPKPSRKRRLYGKKNNERACSVYLRKKTRYEFYGFIDAVESFGIFIKAIDYPFSGLARLKRFNFKSNTKSKDNIFKVGQMVKFKIKRNNIYNGKILLEKIRLVEKNEKF